MGGLCEERLDRIRRGVENNSGGIGGSGDGWCIPHAHAGPELTRLDYT